MLNVFRATLGDALWAQVEEALEVGGSTHTLQDVVDASLSGEAQVLLGKKAVAFTEIISHPQAKVLHVWLVAGDMEELFGPLLDRATAFALYHGCDRLTMVGRRGWERTATKIGFEATHVAMTKRLDGANNKNEGGADDV